MSTARAIARANIALAKYWGKSDDALNLPAVPSVSMTLEPMRTVTTVTFREELSADRLCLGGDDANERERERASVMLDRVRSQSGIELHAEIVSDNDFPTASGLASSASGFCALAAAARAAAGMPFDRAAISRLARASSVSAARSAYGGYVELPAGVPGQGELAASSIAEPDHWALAIVVAVTSEGRKDVGSTDGMGRTRETSPYYSSWVEAAPRLATEVREGLRGRDLERVGRAMEQSTLAMHACGFAADPGIIYLKPATLAALELVRTLRSGGLGVWATMDAGPHVKALCLASDAERVAAALQEAPGVLRTILTRPGPGVEIVDEIA
jgi:diphosphomevalonate decarboxylase